MVRAYDVAVYSGAPCGIAAAVAAAREGARVVLIEPSGHVGGLNTSGLNTAESEHMLTWTIGGIAREFYTRLGTLYGRSAPLYYFESHTAERAFGDMLADAGVEVCFGRQIHHVHKDGHTVVDMTFADGSTIAARVFVDASYEGDVMARAGIGYAVGRESRAEFGEDLAGIRLETQTCRAVTVDSMGRLLPGISGWVDHVNEGDSDPLVMSYNWRLCFSRDSCTRVAIPEPTHYDRARYRLLENWLRGESEAGRRVELTDVIDLYPHAPGRDDKWEVNNRQDSIISLGHLGGQAGYADGDDATRARIVADHTEYTLGLFHFLANDACVPAPLREQMRRLGLARDEFVDNGHWPYKLYVREARRMRGMYVMTQRDIQLDRRKPDAIAVGSHFIDCHHVQRLAVSETEFVNEGRIWRKGSAYQIPYRSLVPDPEEAENVVVPGAASFSHVAFCAYRLESTWMTAGHAAGTAAAKAALTSSPVQEVDVAALQDRLRSQGQVVDFLAGEPQHFPDGPGWPEF